MLSNFSPFGKDPQKSTLIYSNTFSANVDILIGSGGGILEFA